MYAKLALMRLGLILCVRNHLLHSIMAYCDLNLSLAKFIELCLVLASYIPIDRSQKDEIVTDTRA